MNTFRKYLNSKNLSDIKHIISANKNKISKDFKVNSPHTLKTIYEIIINLMRIGDPLSHYKNATLLTDIFELCDNTVNKLYGSIFQYNDNKCKCMMCNNISEQQYLYYIPYHVHINTNSISFWCSNHMYNIVQYSEQLIQTIYKEILDKYILFTTLDLNIDVINYIFINYMILLSSKHDYKDIIITYFI